MAVIAVLGGGLYLGSRGNDSAANSPTPDQPGRSESDERAGEAEGEVELEEGEEPEEGDERTLPQILDPIRPDSLDTDANSVWVSDASCGVVVQVDKATEQVVGTVTVGASASGVALAGGSVWVGTRDEGSVVRINPAALEVSGMVGVPGFALGLSADGDDIWATDPVLGAIYRIDAVAGALAESIDVGFDPHNVEASGGTVWVTNQGSDTVTMIQGGRSEEIQVGGSPLHVTIGAGSAWVTDSADNAVRRLNENTGQVEAVIEVGAWPHALSFANGSVWVGTETGSFWRIDPGDNSATQIEDAEFASIDSTVDGSDVWVADASGGTIVRFDTTSGTVGSVIDLNEFGDCTAFRSGQIEIPADPQRAPSL